MMVLHRATRKIEHRTFSDFAEFLRTGDLVVLNDARVIPARAFSDDGAFEFLFLEETAPHVWKCLVRPGRKMRVGAKTSLGGVGGHVVEVLPDGERVIAFEAAVPLEKIGLVPIPPYLGRAPDEIDSERYQTVFAQAPGAVAAPTAGLHFTPEILGKITHTFITLHVGAGTFRPVQTERLDEHRMHRERFEIGEKAAAAIRAAVGVIAIGTTTTRVLESCRRSADAIYAQQNSTDIFIRPPFEFRAISALLTNFHLPRSTLLMLVSAFADREFILEAYAEAIREKYRFYSYGDCMLII